MATDDKYDRQLRLWGAHGQRLLATSHVVLLGATGAGTETLKNLILPAVGRFTIVDDQLVTMRDCGNNFFVTVGQVGENRARVTCENLNELNPDV
jgi:amyloid beta precursor protein binding protein 1